MTAVEQIKEVLDANLKVISAQIEIKHSVLSIKLAELKEDTEEIKKHAKETNGRVQSNKHSIIVLEEKQIQETRRLKQIWAVSVAVLTAVFGTITAFVVHRFAS